MTGLPVVVSLVTLNIDSCVAGSGLGRATAHHVAFVSISFAATGVNAWVLAFTIKGAASSNLKLEAGGQLGPAGGFEIPSRSEPTNEPPLLNTLEPMIEKNWLSPSFGKSGKAAPKLSAYLQKSAALFGDAVLLKPNASRLVVLLTTSSAA